MFSARVLFAALLALLTSVTASAQTNPGFQDSKPLCASVLSTNCTGQPTTLNGAFTAKQDFPGQGAGRSVRGNSGAGTANLADLTNPAVLGISLVPTAGTLGAGFQVTQTPSGIIGGTVATSATTAAGNNVLTFTAVPAYVTVGMSVTNLTKPQVITRVASVIAVGATTVTLSSNVLAPGVGLGDNIRFGAQQYNNYVTINSDSVDTGLGSASSYGLGFTINHAYGGAAATGGREGLFVGLTQIAPTSPSNTVRFYAAVSGQGQANSSDGGTILRTNVSAAANNGSGLIRLTVASTAGFSTGGQVSIAGIVGTTEANNIWIITVVDGTHFDLQNSSFQNAYVSGGVVGNEKGRTYGSNFLGVLTNGATGFEQVMAGYDQVFMTAGSSSKIKAIRALVYGGGDASDAVQGSLYDAALMIGAEPGAVAGGQFGVLIGNMFGAQPLAATATAFGFTGNPAIAHAFDASTATCGTDCFKSNGFLVDPTGNITANNLTTAWTAFTPAFTCGTATITNNSARARTVGKTTWIEAEFTITAIGTCGAVVSFTLPNTTQSSGSINGSESVNTNAAVFCRFGAATTTASCIENGGGVYGVNAHVAVSGVYENQ